MQTQIEKIAVNLGGTCK